MSNSVANTAPLRTMTFRANAMATKFDICSDFVFLLVINECPEEGNDVSMFFPTMSLWFTTLSCRQLLTKSYNEISLWATRNKVGRKRNVNQPENASVDEEIGRHGLSGFPKPPYVTPQMALTMTILDLQCRSLDHWYSKQATWRTTSQRQIYICIVFHVQNILWNMHAALLWLVLFVVSWVLTRSCDIHPPIFVRVASLVIR